MINSISYSLILKSNALAKIYTNNTKSNTKGLLLITTYKLASRNAMPNSLLVDQNQEWDMDYTYNNYTFKSGD